MGTRNGLFKKLIMCVFAILIMSAIFTGCELQDPITEFTYYINDNQTNYYNQDHTTTEEAVTEFTDSITALRDYLDSESFVDTGYFMGVDFDIDILDPQGNTAGHFTLRIKAYLYTFPYETEDGDPIYKYYEDGKYYDENNDLGTRKLVPALEIHNQAIKKSDFAIEWYNGATNEVLIGLYFDGLNSNSDNPGNILYANIQGYKRSFPDFGDTVLFQQMIRMLMHCSVEGVIGALGLGSDTGTGAINNTMVALIGDNYKRVINEKIISLLFYSVTLDAIKDNINNTLYNTLGVFEHKWDPMSSKFLGFKISTVANALVQTIDADMQAIISPDKNDVKNVLTNAVFAFRGVVDSYDIMYTYTADVHFDYGWSYPDDFGLDTLYYNPFDYGNYEFKGMLYVPAWDAQFDALIRTDMNPVDNSTNYVFMEFRDIANGELMIGIYYRHERSYLDITGLEYMYGWIDLAYLGFPRVYDEHMDLAEVLNRFNHMINNVIVAVVDSLLDPSKSDKENKALEYIMAKTTYSEKIPFSTEDEMKLRDTLKEAGFSDETIEAMVFEKLQESLFSKNTETLRVDIELVKQMLEETGAGTYTTRQIINILDSMLPYTMDQIAIMLGIASAEIMLEKTYFTFTWDVDKNDFTIIMYTNVGVKLGDPSKMIFQLDLTPTHFGEWVPIADIDFSGFKPLQQIYTYSGTLRGNFIFSSQEVVDLSELLSATIGESSGLNTPYALPANTGLEFQLIYDQFVTDQVVEGRLKQAGRSAFELIVWLTGTDAPVLREEEETTGSSVSTIITLCSDDVSFNNEVYKDQPAREAELGYIWVNIACVKKNGTQVIPKMKIREDVFMASMYAYMNKQSAIEDDIQSFADNDFNLSLTSIISALMRDAYVVPEPEQMEITSSNDTLQSLFRVNGLIGNIKVDAGFTYRVEGLESIRKQYYMYEVGFFENIIGDHPYNTPLHSTLPTFFYMDYMDEYDPLKYDFYVYPKDVLLDDGRMIEQGTILLFELGALKTVAREPIEYGGNAFFMNEPEENQDIKKVKFQVGNLPFIDYKEGKYYYNTYYNKVKEVNEEYVEIGTDGTVYIYWLGIDDVLMYDKGSTYYYFDKSMYLYDEYGEYVYIELETDRQLLFEYDPLSVEITEACKTQYAPRTNGSFMGEVRRYFVLFESMIKAELGKVTDLYYDANTNPYPQYYSDEDRDYIEKIYDDDGVLISEEAKPIMLYVMEPFEALTTEIMTNVATSTTTTEVNTFDAKFWIDWSIVTGKGYMLLTEVTVAPGMMGEITFPVRIIVTNREVETNEYVSVYTTEEPVFTAGVPVVDSIEIDPYDYLLKKYEFFSNPNRVDQNGFNPAYSFNLVDLMNDYNEKARIFSQLYFGEYKFKVNFKYLESYLYLNGVDDLYIAKQYQNTKLDENGNEIVSPTYAWNFDRYAAGTNSELSVSPDGGVIYLHTRLFGQLVALKVIVGKREFSHLKFGEDDTFNKEEFEANNNYSEEIKGYYNSNYYDKASYTIGTKPIFVFKDDEGAQYEYIFDMELITGLKEKGDGTYSSEYVKEFFELKWENGQVTYVSTDGSYYLEYEYEQLYKYGETKDELIKDNFTRIPANNPNVKVFDVTTKTISVVPYYKLLDGDVYHYKKLYFAELENILEDEIFEDSKEVSYGTKRADKYIREPSDESVFVRSDEMVKQNRPFYYFYDTTSNEPYKYLTDEEYEQVMSPGYDGPIKFNTDVAMELTTTSFKPYYLFRIYAQIGGRKYAISITDNELISEFGEEEAAKDSATGFRTIVLRIKVECPALDLVTIGGEVENGLKPEQKEVLPEEMRDKFTPNRILYEDKERNRVMGEIQIDPLNPETLYLPDNLRIYFSEKDNPNKITSHLFDDIVWGEIIYFGPDIIEVLDANKQVIYYGEDDGREWGAAYTIRMVLKDGEPQLGTYMVKEEKRVIVDGVETTKNRYKLVGIDLEKEMNFPVQLRIGDEARGYKAVTVDVKVLSKDPTDVQFFRPSYPDPIDTVKTTVAINDSGEILERNYYNYYVNTFEGFEMPDRLYATFSDGHSETYYVSWKEAKTESDKYAFSPNTLVTLYTRIGTEGGVSVEIYLCVIVANTTLLSVAMVNEYINYYVVTQYQNGNLVLDEAGNPKKTQLRELFRYDPMTNSIGYYIPEGMGNSEAYIRISTGSGNDDDVENGRIGLYLKPDDTNYGASVEVTPYDLLTALYSRTSITVSKREVDYVKQNIGVFGTGAISIYEYDLLMENIITKETRYMRINEVMGQRAQYEVTFDALRSKPEKERFNINLIYIDEENFNQEYRPYVDEETGKLTIRPNGMSDEYSRTISYGEYLVYLTEEDLSVDYSDWKVEATKSYGRDDYKQFVKMGSGDPYLKDYYRYGVVSGLEILAELRTEIAPPADDASKYGYVRLSNGAEIIEMSYFELCYRLNHYIKYIRVKADKNDPKDPTEMIDKKIEINDLYATMDISDMTYRNDMPDKAGKYIVSVGATRGSYDLDVYARFAGGYYFGSNSNITGDNSSLGTSAIIKVESYNDMGAATYAGGYRISSNVIVEIAPIRNDGSNQSVYIRYNYASDEEQLTRWHIDSIGGDREYANKLYALADTDGCITAIPADIIYKTNKDTFTLYLSALTSEGFRVTRTVSFENIPSSTREYSSRGGAGLTIKAGVIHIENIYDYYMVPPGSFNEGPSLFYALGSPALLPTTIALELNNRIINVSNVKWEIDPLWYGGTSAQLDSINYTGTSRADGSVRNYTMATANILGYKTDAGTLDEKINEPVTISVLIEIDSAEALVFPWEQRPYALKTETIEKFDENDNAKRIYVVYMDAFKDTTTSFLLNTHTFELPKTIRVEYDSGKAFDFNNVVFKFSGKEVKKLLFTQEGLDYYSMIQDPDCLHGFSMASFYDEYIDLDVDIGLGQVLTVRFYFYDKTIMQTRPDDEGGYAYVAYYKNNIRVYMSAIDEADNETDETTGKKKFIGDEQGRAYILKKEFSDVAPLIELDDATIRSSVMSDITSDLNYYQTKLYRGVNFNRVRYNVKRIIETAQDIKSDIPKILLGRMANVDINISYVMDNEIRDALRAWMEGIVEFDDTEGTYRIIYPGKQSDYVFDLKTMPETSAYKDENCYEFAITELVYYALAMLPDCEAEIVGIMKGSGTNASKLRRREEAVTNYIVSFANSAYDSMIRQYLEREYLKLFKPELQKMSNENFNDAVYYKNLVEAAFDEDALMENIYKLRSFYGSGTDAWIALRQFKLDDDIVEKMNLKEITKNCRRRDGEGNNLDANDAEAYHLLVEALIIQALFDAYAIADKKVPTTSPETEAIKIAVKIIIENRLQIAKYGLRDYEKDKYFTDFYPDGIKGNQTYTIMRLNEIVTSPKMTKKAMRMFLANMIAEATDFRDANASVFFGEEMKEYLIKTTFSSITNYMTTIRAIRRSLINGSEIESILSNLLIAGIRNFAETVNGEYQIIRTIRNMQKANNIIIPVSRFAEDGGSAEFEANKFFNLAALIGGEYIIDSYYAYRGLPDKIIVYFNEGMDISPTQGVRVPGNVGGFPLVYKVGMGVTEIWEKDTDHVTGKVTYLGTEEEVTGNVKSDVIDETTKIKMRISVKKHILDEPDKEVTSLLIKEATDYMASDKSTPIETSDKKYTLIKKNDTNRVHVYDVTMKEDKIDEVLNVIQFTSYSGVFKADWVEGYDYNHNVLYKFVNRRTGSGGVIDKQSMYVYNPFEFDQQELLPASVMVDGELTKIRWQNASIQPTGNITTTLDGSQQLVTGTIANSGGQSISMYIYVARWSYSGIYKKSEIGDTSELYNGEYYAYMNPINFYFSQQMTYSPDDSYLLYFTVSILHEQPDGTMMEEQFGYDSDKKIVYGNSGFIKRMFYPENSRLLEYDTDDKTMEKIDNRSKYKIYWETASRNRVINGGLSSLGNCTIFLGNDDLGSYSLGRLRAETDNITPITVNYCCEKMYVNEVQAVTNDNMVQLYETSNGFNIICKNSGINYTYINDTVNLKKEFLCGNCGETGTVVSEEGVLLAMSCSNEACSSYKKKVVFGDDNGVLSLEERVTCKCDGCELYKEIESTLMQQSGKTTVAMSINTYYPTSGYIKLYENNIHYREDEIKVRYIWRQDYNTVVRNMRKFIEFAYPEVENSARDAFSLNLLMTWDDNTESEKEEIIGLALDYVYRENIGTLNYTEAKARQDAYKLLAINEQYDISADTEKLKGGANNAITPTVMVRIGENTVVYTQTFIVRVLFMDYLPLAYFNMKGEEYTSTEQNFEGNRPTQLKIAVRRDYWDRAMKDTAYVAENRITPYDDIGDMGYQILHLTSLRTRETTMGRVMEEIDGHYIIEVTNISWEIVSGYAVSTQFVINGITYKSNLLQIRFIS